MLTLNFGELWSLQVGWSEALFGKEIGIRQRKYSQMGAIGYSRRSAKTGTHESKRDEMSMEFPGRIGAQVTSIFRKFYF
jgi:hypothetical protein